MIPNPEPEIYCGTDPWVLKAVLVILVIANIYLAWDHFRRTK